MFLLSQSSTTFEVVDCADRIGNYTCNTCDDNQHCSFSIGYVESSSLAGYFVRDYMIFGDRLYGMYLETLK
jgi:hypothetical protein